MTITMKLGQQHASASVAFSLFVTVIIYHASSRLLTLKKVRDTKLSVTMAMTRWIKRERAQDLRQREDEIVSKAYDITHTSVELYSPLL